MLRMALFCVSVVVLTLSLPAAAAAQNAMAGIVRDDSGAVASWRHGRGGKPGAH